MRCLSARTQPHSRPWPALMAAVAAFLCLLPAGCDGDDAPLPAYHQDLVELETDGDGFTARLVTDGGERLTVDNRRGGLTRDSVYRVTALYTREGTTAVLHSATAVLSPVPREYSENAIRTDPVEMKAAWRGGRYLNLRIVLQTGGKAHYMGFIDRGITQTATGTRILHVELLHNQNGNPLYYPRETILSCPLYPYSDRLRSGTDSVALSLRTFKGDFHRTFPF